MFLSAQYSWSKPHSTYVINMFARSRVVHSRKGTEISKKDCCVTLIPVFIFFFLPPPYPLSFFMLLKYCWTTKCLLGSTHTFSIPSKKDFTAINTTRQTGNFYFPESSELHSKNNCTFRGVFLSHNYKHALPCLHNLTVTMCARYLQVLKGMHTI